MPRKLKRRQKKKTTTKPRARRRATANKVSHAKPQIEVYQFPHSNATSQPKIPDGKSARSLGLSNQTAGELIALQSPIVGQGTSAVGDGTIHILMYAGQNSGAVVLNTVGSSNPINGGGEYETQPPTGEIMGWSGCPDTVFNGMSAAAGGNLSTNFEFSQWRVVSQGMVLGLLNPAEEDDGWWEAIRVRDPLDSNDYQILPRDRDHLNNDSGTVVPKGKLSGDLMTRGDLPNTPSYATGLLRDIHKHYFQLLPAYKDHDFLVQSDDNTMAGQDIALANTIGTAQTGRYVSFNFGQDDAKNYIKTKVDESFDMIYIRIHGRSATTPSRIHYNLVNNCEVTYAGNTIEARFMTPNLYAPDTYEKAKQNMMKLDKSAYAARGQHTQQPIKPP